MDKLIRVVLWVRANWFPIALTHAGEIQVGHAGIWVGPCYYSLWPTQDIIYGQPLTSLPGIFSMSQQADEQVLGGPPTNEFTFETLCVQSIRNRLAVELGNTNYTLWNRNCSTFVLDLLLRGYEPAPKRSFLTCPVSRPGLTYAQSVLNLECWVPADVRYYSRCILQVCGGDEFERVANQLHPVEVDS